MTLKKQKQEFVFLDPELLLLLPLPKNQNRPTFSTKIRAETNSTHSPPPSKTSQLGKVEDGD